MEPTAAQRSDMMSQLQGAQERLDNLSTVDATQLERPAPTVNVPEPEVATETPPMGSVTAVADQTNEIITAQTEEAQRLRELREEQASLSGEGSLADMFNQQLQDAGVPENTRALRDIQLQLADMTQGSMQTQSDLARAAGATASETGRAISAEKARNNVRSYGLAARAAVLQGNIQTASQLASQAVSFAYQDRTLRNTNLINQINSLQGVVDNQTAQLLRQEERVYQADQAMVERVQNAVDSALSTGVATDSEISLLTSPTATDNERLAMAQLIGARGATDMRDLQTRSMEMDLAVKARQLAKLREPTVATRSTQVVEVGNEKQLVDTQTGEVIATFGAGTSINEINQARDINFVNTLDGLKTHPGMSKAVGVSLPFLPDVTRFTPFKSDVLSGDVADFTGSMENVVKQLTLNTFAEAKEQGMTFGAMSQGEWDILGESATKISQWQRETEDGYVYYDTSENNVKKELDVLSNFAKMDALRKGAAPEAIGVLQQEDGTYWTKNSSGDYVQLEVTTP